MTEPSQSGPDSASSPRPDKAEPVRVDVVMAAGSSPRWRLPWVNIGLFLATVVSTFYVGLLWAAPLYGDSGPPWYAGWIFAVPLLSILLFHEFGHYIAARVHRVNASLPYFIPLPLVFGTFGAVIRMRGRIQKRNALMDIGASGPLAGMAVALPVLIYGIILSEVKHQEPGEYILEGHSILYEILLLAIHGGIPEGHDIFMHPVALAGWVGIFVTMLNLIPVGQLDGGHVAYSLFGERQNRFSDIALYILPVLGLSVCSFHGLTAYFEGTRGYPLLDEFLVGINWFVWFGLLQLMRFLAGKKHPPVDPGQLTAFRKLVGVVCLVLFILIFMPVPLRTIVIPAP